MIRCEYHKVGYKRKLHRKDLEEHKKQKVEEHLMMTKSKLAETNTQLSTAMKQINNLAMLMNAQLSKSTITADVWSVHLDTTATKFKLGNQVCPVTIKMEKYNDRKSNNIPWVSDFFYAHNKGYKMCLKVYAGGKGKGEGIHMLMFLYLVKGSYDD